MPSQLLAIKVLHICQRDDPAIGGSVRVAAEFVKRLSTYGADAHCLFLYGPPGQFRAELGIKRTHYLSIRNSKDVLKFGRLFRFLKWFQPDIIHHHDGLLWPQLFTFRHPKFRKVAHAHLTATHTEVFSKARLAAWCQQISTDLLVCISQHTRQSQIEQGKYASRKTCVIYNGVDQRSFYPPSNSERIEARRQFGLPLDLPVVGYVGRLECTMKGTDDFLRTVAELPEYFWALVVGSGPDGDYLRNLASKLDIAQRVVFTGNLSEPIAAYHAIDIFCLTSHWEPFGLVVAEAMACDIPVSSFLCEGGVNEILTSETGWIVTVRSPNAMAEIITQILANPHLSKTYIDRARLLLNEKFSWEYSTARLAQMYKNLIGLEL